MIRVTFIVAVSADGFIAESEQHPTDWTSKEDKQHFAALTREAGVIVMGARTFATIGRALPDRRNIVYSHKKIDVPDVEVTQEPPQELVARLEKQGFEQVAVIGGREIFDLFMNAGLMDELYVTIEPILLGAGLSIFKTATHLALHLLEVDRLNADTIVLHYARV